MLKAYKSMETDFMNILDMNMSKPVRENASIMREVKKGVDEGEGGFVDILSLYSRG